MVTGVRTSVLQHAHERGRGGDDWYAAAVWRANVVLDALDAVLRSPDASGRWVQFATPAEAAEAAAQLCETLHGLALLHGVDPATLMTETDAVLRTLIRGSDRLASVHRLVTQLHHTLFETTEGG